MRTLVETLAIMVEDI
jgi:hypothetical protein